MMLINNLQKLMLQIIHFYSPKFFSKHFFQKIVYFFYFSEIHFIFQVVLFSSFNYFFSYSCCLEQNLTPRNIFIVNIFYPLLEKVFTFMHWRRKWQPTPVFLPGESQGWGSLVGCHLWGRTESDTTEATQQQQQQ